MQTPEREFSVRRLTTRDRTNWLFGMTHDDGL